MTKDSISSRLGLSLDRLEGVAGLVDELRRTKALVSAFLHCIPMEIMLKDLEGRYTYVNSMRLRDGDVTLEELLGHTVHDFYPPAEARMIDEIDRRVKETHRAVETEMQLTWRDGSQHDYFSVDFAVLDTEGELISLGVVAADITQKKRDNREKRRSAQLIRAVIDNVPYDVSVSDFDNNYLFVNRALADYAGKRPDELIGKNLRDIWDVGCSTIERLNAEVIKHQRVSRTKIMLGMADGTQQIDLLKFPIYSESGQMFAIGSMSWIVDGDPDV